MSVNNLAPMYKALTMYKTLVQTTTKPVEALDNTTTSEGKNWKIAGKVVASVFWDAMGVIMVDSLKPDKKTEHILQLLMQLR